MRERLPEDRERWSEKQVERGEIQINRKMDR